MAAITGQEMVNERYCELCTVKYKLNRFIFQILIEHFTTYTDEK